MCSPDLADLSISYKQRLLLLLLLFSFLQHLSATLRTSEYDCWTANDIVSEWQTLTNVSADSQHSDLEQQHKTNH